jgi:hypothetical protein
MARQTDSTRSGNKAHACGSCSDEPQLPVDHGAHETENESDGSLGLRTADAGLSADGEELFDDGDAAEDGAAGAANAL